MSSILTPENVDSVITSVTGKTKREVLEIKVRFAPLPDVKDMIRRLPSPTAQPTTPAASVTPPVAVLASAPVTTPARFETETELPRPSLPLLSPPPVAAPPAIRITPPMPAIVPIKENGYKVQFEGDTETVAKIDRIKR